MNVFEITEAFAIRDVKSGEHLKVPYEKVNTKGGTIALAIWVDVGGHEREWEGYL
ncbi:hypothetical protein BJ165DRAFT_1499980 [Panaeolus papilionaceus]|nr:hypothetical protein BJ165DRAFT_1499980 [Panaeolus papilionaceus]